jgi:hypothetical protein
MRVSLPLQPTADDIAHFETMRRLPVPAIYNRIVMERAVIRRAATDLLAAGFELRVHNGEDWACVWTTDLAAVMRSIMETDEDHLNVRVAATGKRMGALYLVYGNAGWEVIADNAVCLEEALAGTTAYQEELADAEFRASNGYCGA